MSAEAEFRVSDSCVKFTICLLQRNLCEDDICAFAARAGTSENEKVDP